MKGNFKLTLSRSDDELKKCFNSLKTFDDVAQLFEVSQSFLYFILIENKANNYKTFSIPKKNGNHRTIYSPHKNLLILQQKLLYILTLRYQPLPSAHGFVQQKSIVTNASLHTNKKIVLNFDLENFFQSINFARVRGMFITLFKFNERVATTLANICCHPKGFLPQGAPTSPIVSNIIAYRLDKDLKRLTKGCSYSRYADDITISTNRNRFPKEVAHDTINGFVLSQTLTDVINKNGFKINSEKTRFQASTMNQTVTGITVNKKLNVKRTYIRRVRSILHTIEKNKYNLDKARQIFIEKYPFRHRENNNKPDMFIVLKGMLTHIGDVKGKDDPVYQNLVDRFNNICESGNVSKIKISYTNRKLYENYTYILENHDFEKVYFKDNEGNEHIEEILSDQGTSFLLEGIGLITNAHVVEQFIEHEKHGSHFVNEFYISHHSSLENKRVIKSKLVFYDSDMDIAILQPDIPELYDGGYKYNRSITEGQRVKLIGFPQYTSGQSIKIQEATVLGTRYKQVDDIRYKRYELSQTIFKGNSGGPIVNHSDEVVGIAVKGDGTHPNEIIPISELLSILKSENDN